MARVRQRKASKGSQRWLQLVVNDAPHLLDRAIAAQIGLSSTDTIVWRSPLAEDAYAEYRDDTFLTRLDVRADRPPLRQFWPTGGPRWDGLGRTSRGEVLLVEAKAHIGELASPPTAAGPESRKAIEACLGRVKAALGSRTQADWTRFCYQYTNRLAHLYFLRQLNRIPAYLVFVYFLNAADVSGPRTAEEWAGAIRFLHELIGLDERRLQKAFGSAVLDVFVDVNDIMAATA